MEAKELRIGNYLDFSGKPTDINAGFICDFHYSQENSFRQDAIDFDNVSPIPLTEDWLIKFGFDKTQVIHKDKSVTPITYKVDKRIRLQWYSEKSLEEINTGELMFILDERLIKSVQYVHQLQNLYFALTGKELECTGI